MMKMASALAAVALVCAGCATTSQTNQSAGAEPPASQDPNTRVVKSRDGSYTGEIVGKPARHAKFARLQIGMSMDETQKTMGRAPDQWHTYESGKRWIPYYFGNDARRMQAYYKGEGCLIFTAGNVWGGAGGDLIRIENDASGACYQP
jgi:hypothetical protein